VIGDVGGHGPEVRKAIEHPREGFAHEAIVVDDGDRDHLVRERNAMPTS
jgi:hypothetical protein